MRTPALGFLLSLTGCFVVGGPEHHDQDSLTLDGDVSGVSFDLAAGDFTVRVDDVGAPELHRHWWWRGARPEVRATVDGDLLTLEVHCDSPFGGCGVDHELILPHGADVWGETGSGDVSVIDTDGFMDVDTGSGDVVASGLGPLGALVDTGSGDVALDFRDRPEVVAVDTGSGDVRIDLPEGRYDVQIDTGSGDVFLDNITSDRSADAQISVDTGSGDVVLRGR